MIFSHFERLNENRRKSTKINVNLLTFSRKSRHVGDFHAKVIIFGDFLEGALRQASGIRFLMILVDFRLPGADHSAPKRHQKLGPKK